MMTEREHAWDPAEQRLPPAVRRLARAWLVLGVAALAVAGLFAVLLFPTADFFRIALVVHVDQSVLIWFLAFGGALWSLGACTPRPPSPARWLAFGLAATGTLLVAGAPFLGAGDPLLNNYVPVLRHDVFYAGLGSFSAGALLQAALALRTGCAAAALLERPRDLSAVTAAVATLAAGVALAWTWLRLAGWQGQAYFEFLFWGGGHVLQFAYTQLMLAGWLALSSALGLRLWASPRVTGRLVLLGVLPLAAVPVIYLLHAVDTAEARAAFTALMQWGGGLAAVPVGLLVVLGLVQRRSAWDRDARPLRNALTASLLLFAVGGTVGMAISGVNTVIPAHYHGSIVGVTLALMGLTYHLLPHLGYAPPPPRLAAWQPWVYAIGQLLHVGGLAVSGAMGIQRKTAGVRIAQVSPASRSRRQAW